MTTREEWEARAKDALEAQVRNDWFTNEYHVEVKEVRLQGSYPHTQVAFIFLQASRDDCLFGFNWGPFWEDLESYARARHLSWDEVDPATGFFNVVYANFAEALGDTPTECEPGAITWLSEDLETAAAAARRVNWSVFVPSSSLVDAEPTRVVYEPRTKLHPELLYLTYALAEHGGAVLEIYESADALRVPQDANWDTHNSESGPVDVAAANAHSYARVGLGETHLLLRAPLSVEAVAKVASSLRLIRV